MNEEEYREMIVKRINKLFMDKGHIFIDTLEKSEGVISGAFPLACIFDIDTYGIDVYMKHDNQNPFSPFESFLLSGLYYEVQNGFDPGYMLMDIERSRKYIKPGNITIHVRSLKCDVQEFIEKYFDLTFCMIQYCGGKELVIPYREETLMKKGYWRRWVAGICTPGQVLNFKDRISRYRFRGFEVMENYYWGGGGSWEFR